MKLNLEVLASTSIKRKKPWPKFVWLGEEKESLFLLDRNRLSVVYLPSGKTTRKIPKLSPLLPQIVAQSSTANGCFLVYLLTSGDVAVWHKDMDMLKIIPGLLSHMPLSDFNTVHSSVCLSNDCSKLIVAFSHRLYYVWEKDPRQNVMTAREEDLQGVWSTVVAPDNIPLPYPGQREASSHVVFYTNKMLGRCCQSSVVFTTDNKLSISTLLVRFTDSAPDIYSSHPSIHAEWSNIQYPLRNIDSSCEPMGSKGSYVVQYSPDSQVLAVAVNQRSASLTALLYISPLTETVVIADLKHCGTNPAICCEGRDYWIADLAWTSDSLFLVCMTRHGCLGIAPRLGEPLPLQSSGCSLDMGPTYFLPLHPLISVRAHLSQDGRQSVDSEQDMMKQHFSVATHPRLPMILCSDGYLVTVLHLPPELSCVTLVRSLVLESSEHMSHLLQQDNLNLTLADAYKFPSVKGKVKHKPGDKYQFEKPPSADLMSSLVSEDSLEGSHSFFPYMSSGKVEFGVAEALETTVDASLSNLDSPEALLKHFEMAQRTLFTAWGVMVSNNEDMSRDMENVTKYILKNFVKLFSILLDLSCMDAILEDLMTTASIAPVQNLRLFKLLSLYKVIFHLGQFDAMKYDLLPSILKFSHGTLDLILSSKTLRQQDPRLKTLLGCLAILKFTETMLDKVYVWVPSSAQQGQAGYEHAYLTAPGYASSQRAGSKMNISKNVPSKRLCQSWKLLYKHCLHYQEKMKVKTKTGEQWAQMTGLTSRVQHKLQELEVDLSPRHQHISSGDKLSLNGLYTQALDAWQNQLKHLAAGSESKRVTKLCHAQLYTYLLRGDLKQALDLVDNLLLQSNLTEETSQNVIGEFQGQRSSLLTLVTSTLRNQGSAEHERVPCIRNKAIRKLVQSLARFMAAYFTNETLYVFPSHNPKALPPIHIGKHVVNTRILPLYHRDVTHVVSKQGLEAVWTTERTLEYLMLSGLVWEAVWFADCMGDWKSAFLLSVACKQHHKVAPHLYQSPKISMQLPESLYPGSILERALGHLVSHPAALEASASHAHLYDVFTIDDKTDLTQLTQTLEDILKAGIMSLVDVAPWLLSGLVQRLKAIISQLHPLVPSEVYLPCPPIYCPQPAQTSQEAAGSEEGGEERRLRFAASSITQLILVVLKASNLALPLLRWYIKDLTISQSRSAQFKATTEGPLEELPDILNQHYSMPSIIMSKLEYPSVQTCMTAFRDFCSLQWLVHSRDKLSILLRKREKYLANLNYEDYLKSNWSGGQEEAWLRECFTSLQWAVNLLTFSQFLPDEGSLYKVVLSLLIELPPCEDTADILAEHLHDHGSLDADVQEKLAVLLKQWQAIIVKPEDDGRSARDDEDALNESKDGKKSVTFLKASPRGKTLSVYFEKQCQSVFRLLKKKAKCFGRYDQFVFSGDPRGSTDTTRDDVDLFIGCRPFETKQSFMEFLDTFSAVCFSKLVDIEAESSTSLLPLLEPFAREVKKKELQSLAYKIVNSVRHRQSLAVLTTPRQKPDNVLLENPSTDMPGKSPGLFRSKSVSETSSTTFSRSPRVQRCSSEQGLGVISEDHEIGDINSAVKRSPGKTKMTDLASKFSQSEEALYRDTESEDRGVSLDIDFGQKYSGLQSLLEWLTRWANKHHVLAPGQLDSLLPKVRIHIPPQLVVLALWLVENKYSSQPGDNPLHTEAQPNASQELHNSGLSQRSVDQAVDVSNRLHSASLKESIRSRTRKHMKGSGEKNTSVLSENLDEETLVQNAYAGVLEGNDESESAEISSLGSDDFSPDLQNSLSIVHSGGSLRHSLDVLTDTFNHEDEVDGQFIKTPDTVIRRDRRSPVRSSRGQGSYHTTSPDGRRSPSPKQVPEMTRPDSPKQSGRSPHHSPSHSAPAPGHRARKQHRSPHRSRPGKENSPAQGDSDLAAQLQRVVRGELRRMMEVQHQSMMAMMGAMDETVRPGSPKHSPRAYSRRPRSPTSPQHSLGTMDSEEWLRSHSKKRGHTGHDMREILSELKDLQVTSNRKPETNVYERYERQKHTLEQSASGDQSIPRFLRVAAERDTPAVRFPPLSAPSSEGVIQRNQQIPVHHVQMPLLRLSSENTGLNVLRSFSKLPASAQLPPPGYFHGSVQPSAHPNLPSFPTSGAVGAPEVRAQLPGFPLLRLDLTTHPNLNQFNTNALGEQSDQKAVIKQKLAHDFYQQQMENWQQHNQDKFGKQFLRIDFQKLDSPKPSLAERNNEKRQRQRKNREDDTEVAAEAKDINQETVNSDYIPPHDVVKPRKSEKGKSKKLQQEKEKRSEVKGDEGAEELHDGYAIPSGIFGSYLKLETELGDGQPTNAKFQYDTAKAMEEQRRRKKMVDFATMTKEQVDAEIETDLAEAGVRTAEAATSVTKDTGTDPIQEALIEYNRCIQGNVLAPDIYLGLRFGEDQEPSAAGQVSEPARGFLNVVDIRASSVLRDLEGRIKDEELVVQPDISLKPTSLRASMEELLRPEPGLREEELRTSLAGTAGVGARVGGDALTLRLFQRSHMADDRALSRERSRESVIRQLRDMDYQIRAIDNMSNSMQKDFNSTKLLLSTIESVGDAIHPELGQGTPRSSRDKGHGLGKQPTLQDDTSRSSLTPVQSEKSPQRSVRSQGLSRTQSPGDAPVRPRDSGPSMDVKVSGLSGISDIIGEMLAEGGIDLSEAGLSPEEARELTRRTAQTRQSQPSGFDSVKMSMDKLQQMVNEAGVNANKRGTEEQKALQEWMVEQRHKKHAEYKKHRQQLQEEERHPFVPTDNLSREPSKDHDLLAAEKRREAKRKTLTKENVERRFLQATQLLGDILTDEVVLPEEPLPASRTSSPKSTRFARKMQTRIITPRTGVGARPKTAPSARPTDRTAWEQASLSNRGTNNKTFRITKQPSMYKDDRPPTYDDDERPIRPMVKPFLAEPEELHHSSGSNGQLARYSKMVESLETITEATPRRLEKDEDEYTEPDSESTVEPYRPKPFTEMVRMQRPEITRTQPPKRPSSARSPAESPRSTRQDSQRRDSYGQSDKEKLYGSKHIPGASKRQDKSPRRVKTYTERLQDMKKSQKVYSTPIVPRRTSPPKGVSNIPRRVPKWKGPMHKPMTYTQQLQQLSNKGMYSGRSSSSRKGSGHAVYVRPQMGIRHQGPRHQPQTYTQQLQKLNEQAPKTARTARAPAPVAPVASTSSVRPDTRARPYADPYSADVFLEDPDLESDMSSWEMDERVKQILYEDGESSYGARVISSREYQTSEGISDYYDVIMSNEYADSVNVHEIRDLADAISVSSGSIMSYIDWDAVDQLIGTS